MLNLIFHPNIDSTVIILTRRSSLISKLPLVVDDVTTAQSVFDFYRRQISPKARYQSTRISRVVVKLLVREPRLSANMLVISGLNVTECFSSGSLIERIGSPRPNRS